MNVLSLFDGMSCGRLALERAGIPVTNYYASEIDKYAIQVSKANWPDIQHIGSVTTVEEYMLPDIDLLIGGSPCQGFSFAGKQLNFDDPRSKLFFEFVRLLKECKPKYFLLENVKMKKEYQAVISEALGVEPVEINSALVSAQNRRRLYWTNIPYFGLPNDKFIYLKDILETAGTGVIKNEYEQRTAKAMCIDASYHKGADNHGQRTIIAQIASETKRDFDISFQPNGNVRPHKKDIKKSGISEIGTIIHPNNKSCTHISAHIPNVLVFKNNYVLLKETSGGSDSQYNRSSYLDGKQPTLSSGGAQPKVTFINRNRNRDYDPEYPNVTALTLECERLNVANAISIEQRPRGFNKGGLHVDKSPPITSNSWQENNKLLRGVTYRKLTPVECERLQTVPDGYTSAVSNTQRYKMLGNGWNIDTIVHLFRPLAFIDIW